MYKALQARPQSMKRSAVKILMKSSKDGRTSIADESRSGQPRLQLIQERKEQVQELL